MSRSAATRKEHGTCALCGTHLPHRGLIETRHLRTPLAERIAAHYPERWTPEALICRACLNRERAGLILEGLERERGEISKIEEEISRKATEHIAIAADVDRQFEEGLTFGQRMADAMAAVGGSWPFVGAFLLVVVLWMALNSWLLAGRPFDPYPFILLNLMLSCLAAIQAPIIMMSQSRLVARDRLQAKLDYRVNLKAEIEIASLHEKLDHLLHVQWGRMVEVQETQLELLTEISERRRV